MGKDILWKFEEYFRGRKKQSLQMALITKVNVKTENIVKYQYLSLLHMNLRAFLKTYLFHLCKYIMFMKMIMQSGGSIIFQTTKCQLSQINQSRLRQCNASVGNVVICGGFSCDGNL
jgi:hypothetical protein